MPGEKQRVCGSWQKNAAADTADVSPPGEPSYPDWNRKTVKGTSERRRGWSAGPVVEGLWYREYLLWLYRSGRAGRGRSSSGGTFDSVGRRHS